MSDRIASHVRGLRDGLLLARRMGGGDPASIRLCELAETLGRGWLIERARTRRLGAELAAERAAHAETREALLEARRLAVTAMEIVDHAAAARQALKWLTREPAASKEGSE